MIELAKIVTLAMLVLTSQPEVGTGAFYHRIDIADVCRLRNEKGWLPEGIKLDCDFGCLAAWPKHDAQMIGRYVLADLPGGSIHV